MLLSDYLKKYGMTIKDVREDIAPRGQLDCPSKSSLARYRSLGASVVTKGKKIVRIEMVNVLWESGDYNE